MKEPTKAMGAVMNGKEVRSFERKNPADKRLQMGQVVGVQGTLAIVLANSRLLPGYQLTKQLTKLVLRARWC